MLNLFDVLQDINSFIEYTRGLEDQEGFVIAWEDGHKAKLKSDWYVRVHRAKDALSSENKILELYFNNELDDLLAVLTPDEQRSIQKFCDDFSAAADFLARTVLEQLLELKDMGRKEFALTIAPNLNPYLKPIYFSAYDDKTIEKVKTEIHKMIMKNLGKNINYSEIKSSLFSDVELQYGIR